MTKKTYFKGKKKSVKPKKYAFAGFDESTMDNTQMLNALYNPNYYGDKEANVAENQTAAKNIETQKAMSYDVTQTEQNAKLEYENYAKTLANQQKQVEDQQKQMQEQSKQQAETQLYTNISSIGKDLALQAGKQIAARAAAKEAASQAAVAAAAKGVVASGTTNVAANAINAANNVASAANAANAVGAAGGAASSLPTIAYSGPAAIATIAGEVWKYKSNDQKAYTNTNQEAVGTIGGNALSGAGTGAGIGTMIMPGIGTLIGAGVGALGGAAYGYFKNRKNEKQSRELQAQMESDRKAWNAEQDRNRQSYEKALRYLDYSKNKISENIGVQNQIMRQNRLQSLTESQLSGNLSKTGGVQKYLKGGANATRVPGGQIIPLKNGAVKFVGNKHSEKKIDGVEGIKLDPYIDKKGKVNYQSEVEHDENMTKLKTSDGEEKEYIYSSYLKYGGKPISHHHDDILASTDDPNVIKMKERELAKIQETVAYKNGEKDRSPASIAKYGGLKYQTGNIKRGPGPNQSQYVGSSLISRILPGLTIKTQEEIEKEEEKRKKEEERVKKELEDQKRIEENVKAYEKRKALEEEMKSRMLARYTKIGEDKEKELKKKQKADAKAARIEERQKKKETVAEDKNAEEESKYDKMYTPEQIRTARALFGVGAAAQFAGPLASYFLKPNLVETPKDIAPQLLDAEAARSAVPRMVTPTTVSAPRLGRVTAETEPILARDTANRQFFANIGDPSSMVAMLASTSKSNEAERKAIADAQSTNIELAGREGMLGLDASKANQDASLRAQMANQAAISESQNRYFDVLSKNQAASNAAYLANMDNRTRIALANAQLLENKQNRDVEATSTMGSNLAGVVGDVFSYGAEDAKARAASGDTDVYRANFLPLIFGNSNPKDKTGGVRKKMYGGTKSYTSRLGELKFKRSLKAS